MEPYRREQTRPWSPSDLALDFSLPLQRIKKCEILGNILNWAPSQMSASVVVQCSVVHLKIPDAENRQLFHWPCLGTVLCNLNLHIIITLYWYPIFIWYPHSLPISYQSLLTARRWLSSENRLCLTLKALN